MKVNCPGCGGLLYQTHIIAADGSQSTVGKPPTIHNDGEDAYITCPHCEAKVVMKRGDTSAAIGFRPSHIKS